MEDILNTAIIKVAPEQDIAVTALADQAKQIRDHAIARVITGDIDLAPATEDLSLIARIKKALTEKKNEYVKPIKAHIDAVNAVFASITVPLEEADIITRNKVTVYRQEALKRQQEAEEINRQKEELAKREAAFSGTGEVTIDTTPVPVPVAVKNVSTDLGSVGTMKVYRFEVVDKLLVPQDYLLVDAVKVGAVVRATKGTITIPGIKVIIEETLRVTAK